MNETQHEVPSTPQTFSRALLLRNDPCLSRNILGRIVIGPARGELRQTEHTNTSTLERYHLATIKVRTATSTALLSPMRSPRLPREGECLYRPSSDKPLVFKSPADPIGYQAKCMSGEPVTPHPPPIAIHLGLGYRQHLLLSLSRSAIQNAAYDLPTPIVTYQKTHGDASAAKIGPSIIKQLQPSRIS